MGLMVLLSTTQTQLLSYRRNHAYWPLKNLLRETNTGAELVNEYIVYNYGEWLIFSIRIVIFSLLVLVIGGTVDTQPHQHL